MKYRALLMEHRALLMEYRALLMECTALLCELFKGFGAKAFKLLVFSQNLWLI